MSEKKELQLNISFCAAEVPLLPGDNSNRAEHTCGEWLLIKHLHEEILELHDWNMVFVLVVLLILLVQST